MARGVNKVILIGNLGADPEVRAMPNGSPVTTLNLATSETWKDKQTGEKQEKTEWHRIVLFQRLAEIARDYLKKGAKIYILKANYKRVNGKIKPPDKTDIPPKFWVMKYRCWIVVMQYLLLLLRLQHQKFLRKQRRHLTISHSSLKL